LAYTSKEETPADTKNIFILAAIKEPSKTGRWPRREVGEMSKKINLNLLKRGFTTSKRSQLAILRKRRKRRPADAFNARSLSALRDARWE
jgi:hypothetical protein